MAKTTSKVMELHAALKRGGLAAMKALLEADHRQPAAARLRLE